VRGFVFASLLSRHCPLAELTAPLVQCPASFPIEDRDFPQMCESDFNSSSDLPLASIRAHRNGRF
jgi:hypothetical protein